MIEEILEIVRGLARQETERASETALQKVLGALDPGTQQPSQVPLRGLLDWATEARRTSLIREYPARETPPTDVSGGPKST